MILVIAALLLVTSANVIVRAQSTEKKEDAKPQTATVDAWRQALPASEETDTPPIVVMDEARDNIEARETPAQIETRIRELEGRLMEAFKQRDSAALKQLLADDFLPAGAANITEAQTDKTRFIDWALKNPELKSYAAEKTKVRVFPASTAVVTTYYKQQTMVGGVPTDVDFTATNVWVKRKKQWQVVSHHVSRLPQTEKTVARPAQAKQNP